MSKSVIIVVVSMLISAGIIAAAIIIKNQKKARSEASCPPIKSKSNKAVSQKEGKSAQDHHSQKVNRNATLAQAGVKGGAAVTLTQPHVGPTSMSRAHDWIPKSEKVSIQAHNPAQTFSCKNENHKERSRVIFEVAQVLLQE